MGLKKLEEIKRENEFIKGAKADAFQKSSKQKRKAIEVFSKQTIKLDEKRYLKIISHCKSEKISFQDLMIKLIDKFLERS